MRSNIRWCSDGFEFTCWNSDVVRGAFIIDAHDREIISWRAVVNAGISGSDIRDMMLEAVERRFGGLQDAASRRDAERQRLVLHRRRKTRIFARQTRPEALLHAGEEPARATAIAEAFVKTLKRDYVHVTPVPDAATVLGLIAGWIEDYNDNHPHSGLKMRSPREFIAAQTATA